MIGPAAGRLTPVREAAPEGTVRDRIAIRPSGTATPATPTTASTMIKATALAHAGHPTRADRSAAAKTAADAKRSPGHLASAFKQARSRARGTAGSRVEGGAGSRPRIDPCSSEG